MHLRKVFRIKIYFANLLKNNNSTNKQQQQLQQQNSMENVNNPIKIPLHGKKNNNKKQIVSYIGCSSYIGTYVIYVNADVFVICT